RGDLSLEVVDGVLVGAALGRGVDQVVACLDAPELEDEPEDGDDGDGRADAQHVRVPGAMQAGVAGPGHRCSCVSAEFIMLRAGRGDRKCAGSRNGTPGSAWPR